ncbi:MAG: iron-containing alcohol dehydrogenase [Betaproteobacteria bacterium]|nr:iron-containing alcohol dehydrogenase [Betaproteobacteria bacterium]
MTEVPSGEFKTASGTSVVFGLGAVQRLREKVEDCGGKRALVITGRTIATKTDLLERVKSVLGDRCAGVYSGVLQHVPRRCVIEGAKMAEEVEADILVALGGASPSDAAKGMNLALTEVERIDDFFVEFDRSDAIKAPEFKKAKLPLIAIPTTLSAGEFTVATGITDTERGHKDVYRDARLPAKVVIMDPETTVPTPKELWAATGMKLLSDRFGAVCSQRPLPFADALGLHAIHFINQYLVRSVSEPLDLGARAMLQHAVWMSAPGMGFPGLGMVAAFRHQIGAIYNVPHGIASTIVFPYCINFCRPLIDERLVVAARAFDLPTKGSSATASAVVASIRKLMSELGIPTRLRDVGVPKEGLPIIAESTWLDTSSRNNFRPVESAKQLLGIVEQAW